LKNARVFVHKEEYIIGRLKRTLAPMNRLAHGVVEEYPYVRRLERKWLRASHKLVLERKTPLTELEPQV
jgi:hypothetical protein